MLLSITLQWGKLHPIVAHYRAPDGEAGSSLYIPELPEYSASVEKDRGREWAEQEAG